MQIIDACKRHVLHTMVTPVACFLRGHRKMFKQDLAQFEVAWSVCMGLWNGVGRSSRESFVHVSFTFTFGFDSYLRKKSRECFNTQDTSYSSFAPFKSRIATACIVQACHSLWAVIFWTDEWGSGRILLSRQFVAVSLSNLFFWLVVLRQFSAGVLFLRVNDGVLLFSDSDNNIWGVWPRGLARTNHQYLIEMANPWRFGVRLHPNISTRHHCHIVIMHDWFHFAVLVVCVRLVLQYGDVPAWNLVMNRASDNNFCLACGAFNGHGWRERQIKSSRERQAKHMVNACNLQIGNVLCRIWTHWREVMGVERHFGCWTCRPL